MILRECSQGYEIIFDAKFCGSFHSKITWATTGLTEGFNRRKCILVIFVHWNELHICEVSDVCNWIQFGKDCKDWKYKDVKLKCTILEPSSGQHQWWQPTLIMTNWIIENSMGQVGYEPTTFGLLVRCSTNCATKPWEQCVSESLFTWQMWYLWRHVNLQFHLDGISVSILY